MKEIVIIVGDDADRRMLRDLLRNRYAVRAFGSMADAMGEAMPSGPRAILVGSDYCGPGGAFDPIAACARVDSGAGVVCVAAAGRAEGWPAPAGCEYGYLERPLRAEARITSYNVCYTKLLRARLRLTVGPVARGAGRRTARVRNGRKRGRSSRRRGEPRRREATAGAGWGSRAMRRPVPRSHGTGRSGPWPRCRRRGHSTRCRARPSYNFV